MGSVKDGPNAVQDDADTRTGAFRYFGAEMLKQGFNIGPFDVCAGRLGEDRVQRSVMLGHA
jgi:hypothetical protein